MRPIANINYDLKIARESREALAGKLQPMTMEEMGRLEPGDPIYVWRERRNRQVLTRVYIEGHPSPDGGGVIVPWRGGGRLSGYIGAGKTGYRQSPEAEEIERLQERIERLGAEKRRAYAANKTTS